MVAEQDLTESSGVAVRSLSLIMLRQQHEELVQRVDRVRVLAVQREKAEGLRQELVALRAAVNHHLACEDNLFYAVLRHHHDAEVRRTIRTAHQTVATTAPAFLAFCARWLDGEQIPERPLGFWLALERITNDLRLRIAREEQDIYPFVERHI